MKDLWKVGLFGSLFFIIGFPMIFLVLSMFTGRWIYMVSGSAFSILLGLIGIFLLLQQNKKAASEKLES